jgi:hypothetical protein
MPPATTTAIILRALRGNEPTSLNAIQAWMAAHFNYLMAFWLSLWLMTGLVLLYILFRTWREERN